MEEKKIGSAATRPRMMMRVRMSIRMINRKMEAMNAATTAPTAANVVFIQATARYSSGRSRMCALTRLSSSSVSSRFHLLVGHVLHFHDLVEEERVPLVDERVRRRVRLVHRVRDQLVSLRLKPDEFDDLLDAPDDRI